MQYQSNIIVCYLCVTKITLIQNNMLRIKELIKERGITTKQLSILMKLTRETISRQINDSNPKLSTLIRYANALNVPVSELFTKSEQTDHKDNNIICPHCNNAIKLKAEK